MTKRDKRRIRAAYHKLNLNDPQNRCAVFDNRSQGSGGWADSPDGVSVTVEQYNALAAFFKSRMAIYLESYVMPLLDHAAAELDERRGWSSDAIREQDERLTPCEIDPSNSFY